VEDDANVRQLAVSILTSLGYSTVEADNAKAALQLLDKKPQIALLFSDIVLPGNMDGIDLAREARRRWPDLKILLTSGYTEHALVQDDSLMTGVALIAKPYRKASLASKLSAILGSAPVVSKGESPSC
jgi:CheY-like chemotaxis protein